MRQVGAVVVSGQRVYHRDGCLSHDRLLFEAQKKWPRETFHEAEYDFGRREWDFAAFATLPKPCVLRLHQLEKELWGDADALVRFVGHGLDVPGGCLTAPAKAAYDKAVAQERAAYDKAVAPAKAAYDKAVAQERAARNKAVAQAWAAYRKAIAAAAWAAYKKAVAQERAARNKAVAQARAARNKAVAQAWAAYNKAEAQERAAYDKAVAPAKAAYREQCAFAWIHLFSDEKNRIPIWREAA